jgi:hypothetical protein
VIPCAAMRTLTRIVLVLLAIPAVAWAAAALWIDGPTARPLAGGLALALVLACAAALAAWGALRGALAALVLFAVVLAWWLSIAPLLDRDWAPEYAQLPSAAISGDLVTIRNLRDFAYQSETDFDPRWETRTYDLGKLTGVDMVFSFWGSPHIAHTIMSFQFAEGPPLAFSIETRRERPEVYSAIRGFFRQYELYYVAADERDVVKLRTNYRGELVRLYRLRTPLPRARAMLLSYLEEVNGLARTPRWYNALLHNCTTSILVHTHAAGAPMPWHWQLLANGHLDELLYRLGVIQTALPLAELRARSEIAERGKRAEDDPAWSALVREGLPERPPPP